MKTALIFSGGGARGAYEVGVWKALEELDIKEEYDFSDGENIREFENGKYFLRMEEMEIPIYLNRKVLDNLEKLSEKENISIKLLLVHLKGKPKKNLQNLSLQLKAVARILQKKLH